MSELPSDLKYAKTHEWVRVQDDGTVTVGISDHAQDQMGDMVYVEVPDTGRAVQAGEACAVVESVKSASDVYAPVSGEVVESNAALSDHPEQVNQAPYEAGWLLRIRPSDPAELKHLMDVDGYRDFLATEEH
ncbi:MAG: glycine cleavage system protein H [Chromatiales bacterium 21-64-14]|nr:MAG: glycine cleavage system protein H [Chromatiales bacterium 21-64-14]HQU15790.1 glycine cleavage system protein GcvH [Gammaproteobacteria bacterium]